MRMLPYWEKHIRVRWFNAASVLFALGAPLFAQAQNDAPSKLAAGIAAYERKDYAAAIAALNGLDGRLPKLADYPA